VSLNDAQLSALELRLENGEPVSESELCNLVIAWMDETFGTHETRDLAAKAKQEFEKRNGLLTYRAGARQTDFWTRMKTATTLDFEHDSQSLIRVLVEHQPSSTGEERVEFACEWLSHVEGLAQNARKTSARVTTTPTEAKKALLKIERACASLVGALDDELFNDMTLDGEILRIEVQGKYKKERTKTYGLNGPVGAKILVRAILTNAHQVFELRKRDHISYTSNYPVKARRRKFAVDLAGFFKSTFGEYSYGRTAEIANAVFFQDGLEGLTKDTVRSFLNIAQPKA
jgi:hypothetical protein